MKRNLVDSPSLEPLSQLSNSFHSIFITMKSNHLSPEVEKSLSWKEDGEESQHSFQGVILIAQSNRNEAWGVGRISQDQRRQEGARFNT